MLSDRGVTELDLKVQNNPTLKVDLCVKDVVQDFDSARLIDYLYELFSLCLKQLSIINVCL